MWSIIGVMDYGYRLKDSGLKNVSLFLRQLNFGVKIRV